MSPNWTKPAPAGLNQHNSITMKASTITHNGKTFYFAYAQWPARYLKSWAILDSSELQVNSDTKYFKSKDALIQFIQTNF